MNPRTRMAVFAIGAAGVVVLLCLALAKVPQFGAAIHPYRDLAVAAALAHHTANVISSVNFDQRAMDTFGEELILLASVVGATALLRPVEGERSSAPPQEVNILPSTKFAGYLLLPVSLLLGVDLVAHGAITPGGGFQGGVVLATGLHLLYVAGSYRALRKLRPLSWYSYLEAGSSLVFGLVGAAGLVLCGAFLSNFLPWGNTGALDSAGTAELLNVVAGFAVAGGVVVLLAQFLRADIHHAGDHR